MAEQTELRSNNDDASKPESGARSTDPKKFPAPPAPTGKPPGRQPVAPKGIA